MLKYFQNRDLSMRLGIPLSRWKRWSREFLPPDPLGGLQSGFARQYSVRDAFVVYLAGYLVSSQAYSIPEARQILHDLSGWLENEIIDPGCAAAETGVETASQTRRFEVLITPVRHNGPAFSYRTRLLLDRKRLGDDGEAELWQEQYRENILKPGTPLPSGCYPICGGWVALSALADHFFERLSAVDPSLKL
jgi:hypothetical protein